MTNIDRYKRDIERLAREGNLLVLALQHEVSPSAFDRAEFEKELKSKLPDVRQTYERWYSEALSCIIQLLPDRVDDFVSYYKPKGARKELLSSNYTMSDYLRGIRVTRGWQETLVVDPSAALPAINQQANIVSALQHRFESTLYDIRTLMHADLMDDDLGAAKELNDKGFSRGAGAIAGVVLEGHLASVCERHRKSPRKKNPTISDLNGALKAANIIEVPTWRFIQHLGDLRNKCDHEKGSEPTKEEIGELIDGVRKITKTVF